METSGKEAERTTMNMMDMDAGAGPKEVRSVKLENV